MNDVRPYPSMAQSWVIALIVVAMAVGLSPISMLDRWLGRELAMCIYYLVFFGGSLLIVHGIRKRRLGESRYHFAIGSGKRVALLVVSSTAVLWGVVEPLGGLIPLSESMKEVLRGAVEETGVFTFIYFVLAAPIMEELLFRGIMLDGLLKRYRPLTAILVTSLIFGVVHLNPYQFITGLVLGGLLGWVYLRTGSVAQCIVIHMTANLSGYVARFFVDPAQLDQPGVLTIYGGGVVRFVMIIVSLLIVAAVSLVYLKRDFDAKINVSTPSNPELAD
jgi:membrane protease YdiL (CAAX protease family)